MLDCRSRNAVAIVAKGSAIESWAVRAAALFGVDLILACQTICDEKPTMAACTESALSLDEFSIIVGDRVDAAFVRKKGNVSSAIRNRLKHISGATVRVAVIQGKPDCAKELIDAGAVGWFVAGGARTDSVATRVGPVGASTKSLDWTRTDGQWLVHCTRAPMGRWPGETENQYRDELLLQTDCGDRTAMDSLLRIVESELLVGNAIATAKDWPVVCFSEVPLSELLGQRCYRPHLRRWDYEPYGVAIRKSAATRLGMAPVIYDQPANRKLIGGDQQFRFQAVGKTYDWRTEREWRWPGSLDLSQFDDDEVKLFVATDDEAQRLPQRSRHTVCAVGGYLSKSKESGKT